MRAVRFGSYSICATLAGTPSLSCRRKSISRYCRLWPPPRCRVVIRPCELRPPVECSGRTSDFSGWSRVTSTKSATLDPRRPGVVGLYLRIPIVSSSAHRTAEGFDAVALGERHDRPLGVLALAPSVSGALALAFPVRGVHLQHPYVEDLLDRDLDLCLVRVRVHQERVLVLVQQAVALLRDDRMEDDVTRVRQGYRTHSASSSSSLPPGAVKPAVWASSTVAK